MASGRRLPLPLGEGRGEGESAPERFHHSHGPHRALSPGERVLRTALSKREKVLQLAFLLLTPLLAIGVYPKIASGQEPSGLQAATAIENVLVDAIARSEKSVVAIARVDAEDASELRSVDLAPGPFGRLPRARAPAAPGDADFLPDSFGTGVVVERRGLILTYYHVLNLKGQHYVTTNERKTYQARIKAADPRSDLAVLEIDATNLTPIKLGDAAGLKKGQIVIALGNPYAIARDGQASASWGIVANLGRKAGPQPSEISPSGKDKLYHNGTLIQTDAKLNLGTSGGALLNLKGEMIGLTTALAATSGYEQAAGYAVPVDDTFRRVVDTLKEGREVEYGFLGVEPANLKDFELLRGEHGARIVQVRPGSPAERFGLRSMDVVTRVNDTPIFDADGLVLQVGKLPVESAVQFTIRRDDGEKKLRVELAKYPVPGPKVVTTPSPAWRGLRVDYATALIPDQSRSPLSRIDPDGCVVVTEVEKDSPAAAAQMQVGMYISRVGSTPVHTPREFHAAVAGKSGDVPLKISTTGDTPDTRTIKAKSG